MDNKDCIVFVSTTSFICSMLIYLETILTLDISQGIYCKYCAIVFLHSFSQISVASHLNECIEIKKVWHSQWTTSYHHIKTHTQNKWICVLTQTHDCMVEFFDILSMKNRANISRFSSNSEAFLTKSFFLLMIVMCGSWINECKELVITRL